MKVFEVEDLQDSTCGVADPRTACSESPRKAIPFFDLSFVVKSYSMSEVLFGRYSILSKKRLKANSISPE